MKNKILVPMITYMIHLIICLLLSFDLPFLEGDYMGFGLTFLVIWGISLPLVISIEAIISFVFQIIRKNHFTLFEIISSVIGVIILLIYLFSYFGVIKNLFLNVCYIFVPGGCIFILIGRFINKIKQIKSK